MNRDKRSVISCVAILCAIGLLGCSKAVIRKSQILGTWDLVATSHEPMGEVVIPNNALQGWIRFKRNACYDAEVTLKGADTPVKRAGEFDVTDNVLVTINGSSITKSILSFHGDYLVTVSEKHAGHPLYVYYRKRPTSPKRPEAPQP